MRVALRSRVGVMICSDREFPEPARALMPGGAEVVLVPKSRDLGVERVGQLRARAFENMVAIATADYPAPGRDGRSCAFDGRATEAVDGPPRAYHAIAAGQAGAAIFRRSTRNTGPSGPRSTVST